VSPTQPFNLYKRQQDLVKEERRYLDNTLSDSVITPQANKDDQQTDEGIEQTPPLSQP